MCNNSIRDHAPSWADEGQCGTLIRSLLLSGAARSVLRSDLRIDAHALAATRGFDRYTKHMRLIPSRDLWMSARSKGWASLTWRRLSRLPKRVQLTRLSRQTVSAGALVCILGVLPELSQ